MKAYSYLILSAGTLLAISVLIAGLSLMQSVQGSQDSLNSVPPQAAVVFDVRD